jgi:Spy/CpxP family protein refolding chaperone
MSGQQPKGKNNTAKLIVSVILILGGLVYSSQALWTYTRGIPDPDREERGFGGGPPGEDRRPGPPSPEDREARFNQMADEMSLTQDQRQQITQIWQSGPPDGREGWEQRRQQMESILTPDPRAKFETMRSSRGQQFMNRRLEEAKRNLPPDQYKIYEKRLQERASRWRGRGGRGGGGPGGGGPGGGPGGGR